VADSVPISFVTWLEEGSTGGLTINEEDILRRAREVLPDVRERVARIVRK
jgi:hypothetical protein